MHVYVLHLKKIFIFTCRCELTEIIHVNSMAAQRRESSRREGFPAQWSVLPWEGVIKPLTRMQTWCVCVALAFALPEGEPSGTTGFYVGTGGELTVPKPAGLPAPRAGDSGSLRPASRGHSRLAADTGRLHGLSLVTVAVTLSWWMWNISLKNNDIAWHCKKRCCCIAFFIV